MEEKLMLYYPILDFYTDVDCFFLVNKHAFAEH